VEPVTPRWHALQMSDSFKMVGWSYDPLYNRSPIRRCINSRTQSLQGSRMWRPISRVRAKNSTTFYKMDKTALPMELTHRTNFTFISSGAFAKLIPWIEDIQTNSTHAVYLKEGRKRLKLSKNVFCNILINV
jgi:hypothetical protein